MPVAIVHIARRVLVLAVFALLLTPVTLWAHHGWEWASDEEFEVTGTVIEASLGNPHGDVVIEVDGEEWTIQVGQPWRNDRAGLERSMLTKGTEIKVHGHRSAQQSQLLVKAEEVSIDGTTYDLYPNREK
jgi:hypothetical protein